MRQDETAAFVEEALDATCSALAGTCFAGLEKSRLVEDYPSNLTTVCFRLLTPRRSNAGPEGAGDAAVLRYLARGTLALLAWLNAPDPRFPDLRRTMKTLAEGTLPDDLQQVVSPSPAGLVKAVSAWRSATDALGDKESVRIVTARGSADLSARPTFLDPESLIAATMLTSPATEILLVVERPDYDSTGHWNLRHGGSRIRIGSESARLFDRYYRREMDIRPGDGVRVRATFERLYGPENELLCERVKVVEILEVLQARGASRPSQLPAQRPADDPVRHPEETSGVIEKIEGDFGTLTLREIPIH